MKESLSSQWTEPGTYITPFRFRHVDWRQDGHSSRLLLVFFDAKVYRAAVSDRYPDLPDHD